MQTRLVIACALLTGLLWPAACAPLASRPSVYQLDSHADTVLHQVWSAVVEVERVTEYSSGSAFRSHSAGLAYKQEGGRLFILTAHHAVVGDPFERLPGISIPGPSTKSSEVITVLGRVARVLMADEERDIAVVAVADRDLRQPVHGVFADRLPPLGSPVFCIGMPFAFGKTLRTGIVGQMLSVEDKTALVVGFINPGDSGGPVFTADGAIVGLGVGYFEGNGLCAVALLVGVVLP